MKSGKKKNTANTFDVMVFGSILVFLGAPLLMLFYFAGDWKGSDPYNERFIEQLQDPFTLIYLVFYALISWKLVSSLRRKK